MPAKLPWSKSSSKSPAPAASAGASHPGAVEHSEHPAAPPLAQPHPQHRSRLPGAPQLRPRPRNPERSASRRHSAHLLVERPPAESDFAAHDADPTSTASTTTTTPPRRPLHSHKLSEQLPRFAPQPAKNPLPAEKRSIRSRLGFGSSSKDSDPTPPQSHHPRPHPQPQDVPASPQKLASLGRTVSLRKRESPAARFGSRLLGDQQRPASVYWEQHAPIRQFADETHEDDDDDDDLYDPFLIRDAKTSPSLPTGQSSPASGATPEPHQAPPSQTQLSRANTDLSYHTASGSEYFSPEQEQFQSPHESQHRPYVSPTKLASHNPDQGYQAFHPDAAASLSHLPNRSQDSVQRHPYQFQPKDVQQLQSPPPHAPPHPLQDLHLYPSRSSSRQPDVSPRSSHEIQRQQQTVRAIPQSAQQQDLQYHLHTVRPSSRQDETPPVSRGSLDPPPVDLRVTPRPTSREGVPVHPPRSMPPMQKVPRDPRGDAGRNNMVSREVSNLSVPGAQQDVGQGPPTPGLGGFGNGAQAGNQAQRRVAQSDNDHGRGTPPPGPAASDLSEDEVRSLMKDHKELREKYTKVKKYYFEKEAQVHALQNTLAHQRLSMSRTSLDDSEYVARFTRLDGLISQLAFSIRKSWKAIPPWLHVSVNKDAIQTGKQEMTAVGRAFISCWLVDELFDKYFHPDLETGLSIQLKNIQHNIRRFAHAATQTGEEEESLVAKIITWRLATLDGLTEQLRAPQAADHRQKMMETTHRNLVNALAAHQTDPTPPDLEGGVYMIAELAVNIAVHLPMESRDVAITYFGPQHPVLNDCMKVESGIPALANPMSPGTSDSSPDHDDDDTDSANASTAPTSEDTKDGHAGDDKHGNNADRRGLFGNFMQPPKKGPAHAQTKSSSQVSLPQQAGGAGGGAAGSGSKEEVQRVRLAVGVAVGIRGRSVLVKAPVFVHQ